MSDIDQAVRFAKCDAGMTAVFTWCLCIAMCCAACGTSPSEREMSAPSVALGCHLEHAGQTLRMTHDMGSPHEVCCEYWSVEDAPPRQSAMYCGTLDDVAVGAPFYAVAVRDDLRRAHPGDTNR